MLASSCRDGLDDDAVAHPYVPALMEAAFREARKALAEGEVPVGCVLVHESLNRKLAATDPDKRQSNVQGHAADEAADSALDEVSVPPGWLFCGRNATNQRRHALAHAEFVAVEALAAHRLTSSPSPSPTPAEAEALQHFVLYVTVEPCIMCASMLLYHRIGKVFFGAGNPRFGGNGTVLSLHDSALNGYERPQPEEAALTEHGLCGYPSEGGHRADDAVQLLQWFYERENPNAPGHKRRRKLAEDGAP